MCLCLTILASKVFRAPEYKKRVVGETGTRELGLVGPLGKTARDRLFRGDYDSMVFLIRLSRQFVEIWNSTNTSKCIEFKNRMVHNALPLPHRNGKSERSLTELSWCCKVLPTAPTTPSPYACLIGSAAENLCGGFGSPDYYIYGTLAGVVGTPPFSPHHGM
jgi:hypothetical protein